MEEVPNKLTETEHKSDPSDSRTDMSEIQSNGEGVPVPIIEDNQIPSLIEGILLAHGDPISVAEIAAVAGITEEKIAAGFQLVHNRLNSDESGIELARVGNKYQLRTKAEFAPYVRKIFSEKPKRLSPPALETLAVIAYRQPVVKSEVEKIRGVDCTPTIKTLLERGLIKIIGHQATAGQPALFGTTEAFLKVFSLGTLSELPTLRELRELDRDPGEVEQESEELTDLSATDAQTEAVGESNSETSIN